VGFGELRRRPDGRCDLTNFLSSLRGMKIKVGSSVAVTTESQYGIGHSRNEGEDHIELALAGKLGRRRRLGLPPCRQVRELEPFDGADLFSRLRLEDEVIRYSWNEVEGDALILDGRLVKVVFVCFEEVDEVAACLLRNLEQNRWVRTSA
jgi:hypothetical protein